MRYTFYAMRYTLCFIKLIRFAFHASRYAINVPRTKYTDHTPG